MIPSLTLCGHGSILETIETYPVSVFQNSDSALSCTETLETENVSQRALHMDKERLKERILTYVESSLLDEGRTQVSVDDITGALGMSKKTFYTAFPAKDAMLEELVTRIVLEVSHGIDAIAAGPGTCIEKVVALMRFLGLMYRRFAVPFSEDMHWRLPGVWERIESFRQRKIQETFSRLLDQGRAEGLLLGDVDRAIFLMAFRAAVREIVRPGVLAVHAFTAPDVIEQILRIFFSGIMTESGRTAFAELSQRQHSHSH